MSIDKDLEQELDSTEDLKPLPPNSSGWGMYDTKENNWIGNNFGPLVYGPRVVADMAAQIADVQLKQPLGRTRSKWYEADRTIKKVHEQRVAFSPEEAIRRVETYP